VGVTSSSLKTSHSITGIQKCKNSLNKDIRTQHFQWAQASRQGCTHGQPSLPHQLSHRTHRKTCRSSPLKNRGLQQLKHGQRMPGLPLSTYKTYHKQCNYHIWNNTDQQNFMHLQQTLDGRAITNPASSLHHNAS